VAAISGPIAYPLAEEIVVRETGAEQVIGVGESEAAWQAMSPWMDFNYGVTVDAGTGSFAWGFNRDGKGASAGAWGSILGDEGSGYWIALQAIRAVLRAEDGREPPTRLQKAICESLKIDKVGELCQLFYRKGMAQYEVAALSPVVVEVATQGDAKAQSILAEAGQELALAAQAVIRKLEMADDEFAIIPFGSVFKAGELLLASFREAILKVAPRAKIVLPRYESVVGTLLVAMRQGGVPIDQILTKIEEELNAEPLVRANSGKGIRIVNDQS
jgi:N-acetylglucosamine kinase-like BadF-type ATPase